MTNYLRFPNQTAWETAAATAGFRINNPIEITPMSVDIDTGDLMPAVMEDHWTCLYYSHTHAVDVIGDIYTSGVYDIDSEGTPITIEEPIKLDGYHINIIGELSEELEVYRIESPQTPYRIFSGHQ